MIKRYVLAAGTQGFPGRAIKVDTRNNHNIDAFKQRLQQALREFPGDDQQGLVPAGSSPCCWPINSTVGRPGPKDWQGQCLFWSTSASNG
jgi:hypothetical protein